MICSFISLNNNSNAPWRVWRAGREWFSRARCCGASRPQYVERHYRKSGKPENESSGVVEDSPEETSHRLRIGLALQQDIVGIVIKEGVAHTASWRQLSSHLFPPYAHPTLLYLLASLEISQYADASHTKVIW